MFFSADYLVLGLLFKAESWSLFSKQLLMARSRGTEENAEHPRDSAENDGPVECVGWEANRSEAEQCGNLDPGGVIRSPKEKCLAHFMGQGLHGARKLKWVRGQ